MQMHISNGYNQDQHVGFNNDPFQGHSYNSDNYQASTTTKFYDIIDDWDSADVMKTIGGVIAGVVLLVILIILIKKCCCQGSRGRVIMPPPARDVTVAVYPQQQFAPAHNVTTTYPVSQPPPTFGVPVLPAMPQPGAPYPAMGAPYPTAGAPYPTAGAPYPTAGAPYPTGNSPYPTAHTHGTHVAPYAMPTPSHAGAANAPEAHAFHGLAAPGWRPAAMPPSYEQAVCSEKSSPYNPNYPH